MLMKQQRRKPMARGRDQNNRGFYNGNANSGNHNHSHKSHHNNNNNNNKTQPKAAPPVITTLSEFPQAVTYGSYDYPLPSLCSKPPATRTVNDLPSFTQRPGAIWKGGPLGSTFEETKQGVADVTRKQTDLVDPAMIIVMEKKKTAKTFKLGAVEIDIYNKKSNAGLVLGGATKLVNKFLQKDGLAVTTPLKRNRDEVVEMSSSVKKNRRMQELQADTTMELSFEGKAMDKSDLVKLIDSSGIMQDDTHLQDYETSQMNIDTRNLLQSTEFNFEFKRL